MSGVWFWDNLTYHSKLQTTFSPEDKNVFEGYVRTD